MRTLLTTTALAALFSMGAVAQEANTADVNLLEQGYQVVDSDGLASRLMGFPVYNSSGDDAEQLGEINDIVIGEDGNVSAVILGVGGFLGIGEKNVAVSYDELQWTVASDDTERLVLETSREALEAAAEVELIEDEPVDTAATDTAGDVDGMSPADNTQMAVAPAADQPVDAATEDQATDVAVTDAQPAEDAAAVEDDTQMAAAPVEQDSVDQTETGAVEQPGTMTTADVPAFDPNAATEFDESTLTAEELLGTNVYGPNNEHIGAIGDFVVDEQDGNIDAIIIDFGGFLGIGVKEVAVGYDDLSFYTDEMGNRMLLLNVTREQMEQATAFNRDTYRDERDAQRLQVSSL